MREKREMNKTAVVYFSHSGMNYAKGRIVRLEKGNTKVAAEKIAGYCGAALFELKEAEAYPEDYRECVERAKREMQADARPALKECVDVSAYDKIFLGYPNWCGTMPKIVWTFLESADFAGKKIYPFCTNEGSGAGRSGQDIKKLCPDATVSEVLPIRGSDVAASDGLLRVWVEKILTKTGYEN